jgi:nonribosomal peptide synthetase DhbF
MADARCVHEVFEEQVQQTPGALALVSGSERLTYAELDVRADRLARRLVDVGVRRGSITGVHLARGTDMVVAILAALKAGAGYLVLDPEFPEPRLTGMIRDAAAAVVVTREGLLASPAPLVRPDDDGGSPLPRGAGGASPDDVACVMFTSGSTGQPKGVATAHHSITGSLCDQRYLPFGPDSVWLQSASVSWDVFALELWGALLFGGTCVLHPGQRADPMVIARLVPEHGITTSFLSSSLFNVIVDEYPEALEGLREVMVGGEAPSPPHLARALARYPGLRLFNGYGPVENMIVVSTHPITADVAAAGPVPIGRPLAGKRLHVLDERLRPVADGQTGELYASGEGLAQGYLRRPGLTAERFVACPSGPPGERMYRTGDVVRWHADAPAEFVGRLDDQVKIRGFRVELKEVETALARHPAVASVAVVAVKDHQGEQQLVAYAVPHAGQSLEPIEATLRAYASATMPQFMMPSAFVAMHMFPLTQNGKLDHSALPAPGPATSAVSREPRDQVRAGYEPPHTDLERRLAGIWADVLGVERVGLHDNFFSLGGNSLRAVRIAARIVTAEDLPARPDQIFIAPTVADLADALAREEPPALPSIPRVPRVARAAGPE